MIGARSRPPGPLLCVWFRFHKPRRLPPACCLLGLHRLMLAKHPTGLVTRWGVFYTWTTTQRGAPTADEQQAGQARATRAARAASGADCQTARFDRERESQRGTAEPGEDTSQSGRGQPGKRNATANIKAPPFFQNEKGREARTGRDTRHGWPSLAGALAGKAPACGRLLPPCAGLALALPAGATAGIPARRRRSPRPAARECARKAALAPPVRAAFSNAAPRRGKGCSSSPQPVPRLGWGGRHPQRGAPGRYAGRRVRRQSRAAWPAPQAWPGWQGWPKRRRPGRRRGRPHSPHRVGAGPRRSTCAATGAGLAGGKAREAAPQGLGLAARLGGPAQRLAANLTGPGLPGLGRHISRTDPQGLAGRAAAQPPHRVGRVSGPQAAGAGGTRPARRRATDGSPFPQDARPPERTKEGVPAGHSLFVLLIIGRPASGSRRWQLTPAPAWQSSFYRTVHEPRGVNTGRCPVPG